MATLNLRKGMRVEGMRHDIRQVIGGGASVVGFQERLFSRPALRAALPKSWTLLMPSGPTGTDDNPIAFDKDVWSWPRRPGPPSSPARRGDAEPVGPRTTSTASWRCSGTGSTAT